MPLFFVAEHVATTLVGAAVLGTVAYGSWRYGFERMYQERIGRVIKVLGVLDVLGLTCWH